MKNLIIIFFFIFTAILPVVSVNAQQIPDWANAADKLIQSPRKDTASSGAPLPALYQRFNESAPYWIYDVFTRLNNAGLISPDDAVTLEPHNLNRREGAILTARAYNYYRQNNPYIYNQLSGNQPNIFLYEDIKKLMQEFSIEIEALGYNAGKEASTEKSARSIDKSLKIRGEIRYNIINNSSSNPRYNWNDHRIRTRIYMDKPLDDTWTIHGMLESDKSFSHSNNNRYYTNAKDGKVSLDRYYISGSTNLFNLPVDVEAGATSAYLGDGNILDSDFKGVKLSTFGANSADKSTLYSAGYGKVNDTENMFYAEAYHKTSRDIDYTAGVYRWNNYGNAINIYSLGSKYYTGNYTLGAMYFKANKNDGSDSSNGYVLSSIYGYNRSWVPGTYEIAIRYYNMAGTTYINHTMSGLGSYMNGFKGYGAGWYYTLIPNVILGIEYYDLKDKSSDDRVKTLWGQISYGF
ncbi:hypothetical protein [Pectinatus haikarae]|uniref:SLH domain-containing protein n=1 Tax=Pectinatus haikarae TaxID=349096 RepID=A0ABT9Y7B2_9FIRM|nr:hypothetical protein [Pectinatus haikarae]MDQ0203717.1 hypothetical protein [Pectinatus haikarae]